MLEIVERICTHVGIIANGQLVEQCSLEELRQGSSLEQRFLEKVGTTEESSISLAWLEDGESDGAKKTAETIATQPATATEETPKS